MVAPCVGPDVVAALADLFGHDAGTQQDRKGLATEAEAEGRLQERGGGEETEKDLGRRPPTHAGEDERGHREDDADGLRETLGWPGHRAFAEPETRRDHPRDELAERAQGRSAQDPGHEAVGDDDGRPAQVERDGQDTHDHDTGRHQPGRDLVDRVGEREEASHPTGSDRCGAFDAHDLLLVPNLLTPTSLVGFRSEAAGGRTRRRRVQASGSGTGCGGGGPTYRAAGRMRRLCPACSMTCVLHPMVRPVAKVGVNISRGIPQVCMTTPA